MTKRLIEIDDEELRRAQDLLEAPTIKETVARALREVIAAESRRRHLALLRTGYLEPMADRDEQLRAWRS